MRGRSCDRSFQAPLKFRERAGRTSKYRTRDLKSQTRRSAVRPSVHHSRFSGHGPRYFPPERRASASFLLLPNARNFSPRPAASRREPLRDLRDDCKPISTKIARCLGNDLLCSATTLMINPIDSTITTNGSTFNPGDSSVYNPTSTQRQPCASQQPSAFLDIPSLPSSAPTPPIPTQSLDL